MTLAAVVVAIAATTTPIRTAFEQDLNSHNLSMLGSTDTTDHSSISSDSEIDRQIAAVLCLAATRSSNSWTSSQPLEATHDSSLDDILFSWFD